MVRLEGCAKIGTSPNRIGATGTFTAARGEDGSFGSGQVAREVVGITANEAGKYGLALNRGRPSALGV
jgi:hypothetical protein